MTKNVDGVLVNLEGRPMRLAEDGDAVATFGSIVVNALLSTHPADTPTGEEKARRFELALRLHKGGDQDFTPEDLALLKRLVGLVYPPLVVGQVYRWADA